MRKVHKEGAVLCSEIVYPEVKGAEGHQCQFPAFENGKCKLHTPQAIADRKKMYEEEKAKRAIDARVKLISELTIEELKHNPIVIALLEREKMQINNVEEVTAA